MVSTKHLKQPNKEAEVPEVQISLSEHWEEHFGLEDRGPGCYDTRKDKDSNGSFQLISAIKQEASKQNASISELPYRRELPIHYYDMGTTYSVGNIAELKFGKGGLASAFLNAVEPLLLMWKGNMNECRRVSIKIGDEEINVSEKKDIDKAKAALNARSDE